MLKIIVILAVAVCSYADMEMLEETYKELKFWESCIGAEASEQFWGAAGKAVKSCYEEKKRQQSPSQFSAFASPSSRNPFSQGQQASIFSRSKRQISSADLQEATEIVSKMKEKMADKHKFKTCIRHKLGYTDANGNLDLEAFKRNDVLKYNLPRELQQKFIEDIDICAEKTGCTPNAFYSRLPWPKAEVQKEMFYKCTYKMNKHTCMMYGTKQKLQRMFGGYVSDEDAIAMLGFKAKIMHSF